MESDFDLISAKYRDLNSSRYHASYQTSVGGLEEEFLRRRSADKELKGRMQMQDNCRWLEQRERENEEQRISLDWEPDNVDHQSDNMYGSVTEYIMKDIVDKISAEILQSDFISQIVR